jgi:uncharacterized protein YraI
MKLFKVIVFCLTLTFLTQTTETLPMASAQESPPVLAFYYAWFDQNTWTSGQSADLPAELYTSAEPATIQRHVAQAQGAGIDAFVQSWYGPQEANNQTETNFRTLLDIAQNSGFKAAVDVETSGPFFGDANAVKDALATLLATHAQHPAYLRYQGKPVIFFWRQQRFSVDEWQNIRSQVDPNRDTYWIAEGVDIAYQDVFDGHHLYSIAWAASPADQLAKWSNRVSNYETTNQVDRLWVATAMPGYDDTRLPRDDAFAVPRRNGDYYRETWRGAVASQPDMVIITSFNEWPEGTHIEPSQGYGNLYLDITRELVTDLRGALPAIPAAVMAQTPAQETPDGPYIQVEAITNIRQGPSTEFDVVGTLAAGGTASVTGRTETSDWWQIEFDGAIGWVSAEVVEFVGAVDDVPVAEAAEPTETDEDETDTPSDETTAAETDTPRVDIPTGGVNVRSGPGLDFELLGRLEEGVSAVVIGRNDLGDWWLIEFETGENGLAWVADAVVDFTGDPQSVPFAPDSVDSVEPTTTPTPEPVIAGSVEAIDPVNLRAEPSADSDRVGGLYLGDEANVLAVNEDGTWWQIEFADAPDGFAWVSDDFVEFTGDINRVPIFGKGTPTPTPGPTDTPTTVPPTPTPTIIIPETLAPTATSVYKATSEAILASRTPDPSLTEIPSDQSLINWNRLPWGIVLLLVVIGLFWYQFRRNRR